MTITWFEFKKKLFSFMCEVATCIKRKLLGWGSNYRWKVVSVINVCPFALIFCDIRAWQKILMKVIGDAETNINHLTLTVNIIFCILRIFPTTFKIQTKKTNNHLSSNDFPTDEKSLISFCCQSQTKERFCQTKQSFSVI